MEVGTLVAVVSADSVEAGTQGVVVHIDNSKRRDTVGVMLFDHVSGHTCNGNCPNGFGKYFRPGQLLELV